LQTRVLATVFALEREGRVDTGLTEEIGDKFKISRGRNDKTNQLK
tara:strand:+ start:311 stop:445 length:135 start_codon:yes stop_codon:yes gene_type:complete